MMWILLLLAGWLAATVSGAAGFGGALLLLPCLSYAVGAKAAVPILTVAQFWGNLSRAGLGFRQIRWRAVWLFSLCAVPVSIVGARLFVTLPPQGVTRGLSIFLLLMVAFRRSRWGKRETPESLLPWAGVLVGLVSALAGSAGPLGAAIFLGLHLPPLSYIASEAATATLMHFTKTLVYGKFALLNARTLGLGTLLGGALALGSWTGKKLIQRLPEKVSLCGWKRFWFLSPLRCGSHHDIQGLARPHPGFFQARTARLSPSGEA